MSFTVTTVTIWCVTFEPLGDMVPEWAFRTQPGCGLQPENLPVTPIVTHLLCRLEGPTLRSG